MAQDALSGLTPEEIVERLAMQPHPEGGHYVETYRAPDGPDGRSRLTAIYFLLKAGEASAWHRVDADEVWLWHAGGPLALTISDNGETARALRVGPDLAGGETPQALVPANAWQKAEPLGDWVLVSCLVAPGFQFDGFEMANEGWEPGPG
ncbi:cupin domain-containing protein [Marinicauda algicola]|uniref:Cupin domain-containing protein n=1 Tax=Marinicauda algicola TaxID=2029849 RepID=A0A4S2H4X5_9PROT|nr:cupin domain-containing protein [Marinicauda algicola]TGY90488.1 cupin domain-containing protein [Marinicauda algicola]